MNDFLKTAINKQAQRNFSLEINTSLIDVENRTVQIIVSTEEAEVRRYDWWSEREYNEKLLHGVENIDLTRASKNIGLFFNHDTRTLPFGFVSGFRIEDKKLKAEVKFDTDEEAERIFKKVQSGSLRSISVGYLIQEVKLTENRGGIDLLEVTRWQPFEVSFVTVPADPKAGIGRNLNLKEEQKMPDEIKKTNDTREVKEVQINAGEIRKQELARIREISDLAKAFNLQEVGDRAIDSGATVEQFRKEIIEDMRKNANERVLNVNPNLGLSGKEVKKYSLGRAIAASVTGDWTKAGYERELSDAINSNRANKSQHSFSIPADIMLATREHTTLNTGAIVPDIYLAGSYIDMLRNTSIMHKMGIQSLTGLVGNQSIPKQTGNTTAYWLDETEEVTESEITIGSIGLTPKTVAGASGYSRMMLLQSNPSIDNLVMRDLLTTLNLEMDRAIIDGDPTLKQPRGLLKTTGLNAVDMSGGASWAKVVEFVSKLQSKNADFGTMRWLMKPTVSATLQTTEKTAGHPIYLMGEDKKINGYESYISNQVPDGNLIFGDFSQILVGYWGGLDILIDPYKKSASGGVMIYGFQSLDVAVRYPECFSVSNNI